MKTYPRYHTLSEIALSVGLAEATVHLNLYLLEDYGFVEKHNTQPDVSWRYVPVTEQHAYNWRNDHYNHHYEGLPSEMPLECRMRLTCILLGLLMGQIETENDLSVAECRAVIEKLGWNEWKYAAVERLPPPSDVVDPLLLEPLSSLWYNDSLYSEGVGADRLVNIVKHMKGVKRAWGKIVNLHDSRFADALDCSSCVQR